MPEDKKAPSFDEVMEMLKDPAILHAAAAKHGLKVSAPESEKKETKKRELPSIEIPEDADLPTMIKALNQGLKQISTFVESRASEAETNARGEILKSKEEETRATVQKFAKSKKDFEKLIPFIEPFFNTGKYSIEEAYTLGKRASGEKVEEDKPTKKSGEEPPPRMSKTSENEDVPTKPAKSISARESAKKNLDKILSETKLGDDDPLDEKDEIETDE